MLARTRTLLDDERLLKLAVEYGERRGVIEAEIDDNAKAHWYLVHTFPGDDVRAMRWLARRRFGVFQAVEQRKDKNSGALLKGMQPMFSGWLFVFVFDINKVQSRIRSCPGVMGILHDRTSLKPWPIPDAFVQELREESWKYKDNAPHSHVSVTAERTIKRETKRCYKIDKRTRKLLHRLKDAVKAKCSWDESAWFQLNALEPRLRITLLERALSTAP